MATQTHYCGRSGWRKLRALSFRDALLVRTALPAYGVVPGALIALWLVLLVTLTAPAAWAVPSAHVLRIDPRTSVEDGSPILTTVIDLTEPARVSDVITPCAELRGDAQLACISTALEKPGSLGTPYPFPAEDVILSVRVGDRDVPATYLDHTRFGESQSEPGVGTAWLIVVDVDKRMGSAFDEAKQIAKGFVQSLGPEDLVNLVFIGDTQIVADTKWLPAGEQEKAVSAIEEQKELVRSSGRTRPLLSLIKRAATDSFKSLGNPSAGINPPLHQAMVVISSGYGGGDPSTTGPGAGQLSDFLTRGRLVPDNSALPKLPLPVVSIYTPPDGMAEHQQLARDFMQNLANPEIGGFFSIIREDDEEQPRRIVDTVRERFSNMLIVRFVLSCVAPTLTQSFSLMFRGSPIVGDNSFQEVPVGFDPRDWPLDVDAELTRKAASESARVFPGGTVKVFGNFCWGGDVSRPEIYFLPPGESLPHDLAGGPDSARQVQKRLISLDMRGKALEANDNFVEFLVPDTDRLLHGKGEAAVVRFVVVDEKLGRTSGLTENSVLQVRATERPTPWLWIALGGGGFLVILILLLFLFRNTRSRLSSHSIPSPPSRVDASPYATPAPVSRGPRSDSAAGTRATLEGPAGRFTVLAGSDLRVGRDGTRCAAVIPNARVSGLHATLRFEEGQLMIRDEGSATGTRVAGDPIEAGQWVKVKDGTEIHLGPERLIARTKAS